MLQFDSLSFRYRDYLFRDYTGWIPERRVGVMGRNGTGKTTLLRLLDGRLGPESGSVQVSGRTYLADDDLGRFKHFHARDMLRICDTLDSFDMTPAQGHVAALGMAEHLDIPLGELSKGTAKKVALILGLCSTADVLLLDEPFEGLDAESNAYLTDVLRRRERGCVVVSHDTDELERAVDAVYRVDGRGLERLP